MKNKKPKISIIMGIYNTPQKEYLEKSLRSILDQTYQNIELVICNDGSTNQCEAWAKEICANDKRVKFIANQTNRGLAYSLNRCLKNSSGDYIARMDDDDCSHRDRLLKQFEFLNDNGLDLVSCNINIFDENGIFNSKTFPEVITKKDFLFNSPVVHPAVLATRASFEKVGGYRDVKKTVRVEDYDLFMRMFYAGIKMGTLQESLFDYRDDRNNTIRRKKYKYRINEFLIRIEGYRKLKLLPIGLLFAIKPLAVGLLPIAVIRLIRERSK